MPAFESSVEQPREDSQICAPLSIRPVVLADELGDGGALHLYWETWKCD